MVSLTSVIVAGTGTVRLDPVSMSSHTLPPPVYILMIYLEISLIKLVVLPDPLCP